MSHAAAQSVYFTDNLQRPFACKPGVLQIPETVLGLPVFYKQRENKFYPAWCYALPKTILDLPLSMWEALLWTAIPYFAVGYARDAGRYRYLPYILFPKICRILPSLPAPPSLAVSPPCSCFWVQVTPQGLRFRV